jgi:hypothetical protein
VASLRLTDRLPPRITMGLPLEALESQVLQLPTADRVRLLDRVVASLDADAARDAAWDAVAARREDDAKNDPSLLAPLDEVLARLRETLK